jgi:hypothetical protein
VPGRERHDRCMARRRDGERCEAHAVPGGNVCEAHGGGAPQVRIAARLRELQFALLDAVETWRETGEFADLCKVTAAQRAVEEYEDKLELLSELRRSLAEKRAAAKARPDAAAPAEPRLRASAEDRRSGTRGPWLDAPDVLPHAEILFGPADRGDGGTTQSSPFTRPDR